MSNPIDITSEAERVYHYGNGSKFYVPTPKELHVIDDEKGVTHRVVSMNGRTYRPERGWVGISWEPKPGAPAFVA